MLKILLVTVFMFLGQNSFSEIPSGCRECMSECPHQTRDIKSCDRGCPGKCDLDGMKKAFLKANAKAQSCGGTSMPTSRRGTPVTQ